MLRMTRAISFLHAASSTHGSHLIFHNCSHIPLTHTSSHTCHTHTHTAHTHPISHTPHLAQLLSHTSHTHLISQTPHLTQFLSHKSHTNLTHISSSSISRTKIMAAILSVFLSRLLYSKLLIKHLSRSRATRRLVSFFHGISCEIHQNGSAP